MTADRLPRLYDRLRVWERIPLLVAADARKDEQEYRRLTESSPRAACKLPEHLLASMALQVLSLRYVIEQLDAAAAYFYALFQRFGEEPNTDRDWALEADSRAYFFTANAAAWRTLCAELGVSPQELTSGNYEGWFLGYCEEHMPASTPAAEAMQARLRQHGRTDATVVTAESLLKNMRDSLAEMTHSWPPRAGGAR